MSEKNPTSSLQASRPFLEKENGIKDFQIVDTFHI